MYLGNKASKNIHSEENKRKTMKINDWQARSESWSAAAIGSFWLLFDTWRVVMCHAYFVKRTGWEENKVWTTMRRDQKKMQEDDVEKKAGEESERINKGRLQ